MTVDMPASPYSTANDCMAARMTEMRAQMELRNVHYVYPSRPNAPALSGVSLMLDPGRLVALVRPLITYLLLSGPSAPGCWVVSLLEGFPACWKGFQR